MNKPHTYCILVRTHAHWHTMTDSYGHITWYKIICYFETIDLWVTQWNKSLSEASLQQSILKWCPIHCILMIWSIYLLICWLHRNTVRIQKHTQKKANMTRTLLWVDIVFTCEVPEIETVEAHSFPECHPSSKYLDKTRINYSIFREVFLHYMPPLSCNKKWASWYVRQQVIRSAGNIMYRWRHR